MYETILTKVGIFWEKSPPQSPKGDFNSLCTKASLKGGLEDTKKSAAPAAPVVTIPYDETQAILSYSSYMLTLLNIESQYYLVGAAKVQTICIDRETLDLV